MDEMIFTCVLQTALDLTAPASDALLKNRKNAWIQVAGHPGASQKAIHLDGSRLQHSSSSKQPWFLGYHDNYSEMNIHDRIMQIQLGCSLS